MTSVPFIKMQGAGNDFVVIDNRAGEYSINGTWAERLADRRFGVGCDQLVIMEPSEKADVFMRIYNADGSEIGACGNASRCIGWKVIQEKGDSHVSIETAARVLECRKHSEYSVMVDMGEPKLEWDDIPLSEPRNTEHLGIAEGMLMDPMAVSMGNPHMVFFVKDLDFVRLGEAGSKLEHHELYPERTNVSAAQVIARDDVKLHVWERGAGLTLACGTAACATLVAGVKRDVLDRKATVALPGGDLLVEWDKETNHVYMTGPVAVVYEGQFDKGLVL